MPVSFNHKVSANDTLCFVIWYNPQSLFVQTTTFRSLNLMAFGNSPLSQLSLKKKVSVTILTFVKYVSCL